MNLNTWIEAGVAFAAAVALGAYLRRVDRGSKHQRRRFDPGRLRKLDEEDD